MNASPIKTVGMIGLGAMGGPIAEAIARAGFETIGYDTAPEVRAEGVRAVGSLAEVAAADVIILIVPTDDDVRRVVTGPGGLLAHARDGQVIVVSSSVRPDTCQELAEAAESVGVHLIDAALTGGVRGAQTGDLNLLVGGDQAVADRVGEVLLAFAHHYHVLGGVGAGQVAKTANNLVHWAEIVAIDEALRMAQAFGVEPAALRRALRLGPTDSRTLREIELMKFTWYGKDLEIARNLAADVGLDLPVAALSRKLMDGITVDSVRELLGLEKS